MKTIKYYNGRSTIQVEVNEEVEQAYKDIIRAEWRYEKSKQNHEKFSLEVLTENGMQFFDESPTIEELLVEKENDIERNTALISLQDAVASLKPYQQEMIKMFFYENKSYVEIGQAFGISKQSAFERMQTILKKLKKLL